MKKLLIVVSILFSCSLFAQQEIHIVTPSKCSLTYPLGRNCADIYAYYADSDPFPGSGKCYYFQKSENCAIGQGRCCFCACNIPSVECQSNCQIPDTNCSGNQGVRVQFAYHQISMNADCSAPTSPVFDTYITCTLGPTPAKQNQSHKPTPGGKILTMTTPPPDLMKKWSAEGASWIDPIVDSVLDAHRIQVERVQADDRALAELSGYYGD